MYIAAAAGCDNHLFPLLGRLVVFVPLSLRRLYICRAMQLSLLLFPYKFSFAVLFHHIFPHQKNRVCLQYVEKFGITFV